MSSGLESRVQVHLWLQKLLTQCNARLERLETDHSSVRKQVASRRRAKEDAADLIACNEVNASHIAKTKKRILHLQAKLKQQMQPAAD
jgi:hypothetical protein